MGGGGQNGRAGCGHHEQGSRILPGKEGCCTMDVPWGCVNTPDLGGTSLWDSPHRRSLESKPRPEGTWHGWGEMLRGAEPHLGR